jgi:hypothetical protein
MHYRRHTAHFEGVLPIRDIIGGGSVKKRATTGTSVVSEMSLLFGSVGDLYAAVLGGERIG